MKTDQIEKRLKLVEALLAKTPNDDIQRLRTLTCCYQKLIEMCPDDQGEQQ